MENKLDLKAALDNTYSNMYNIKRIFVLGEGDLDSKIVFIGEAPGADEEKSGHPFVGKAGKNLNTFLTSAGIEREKIYITNAVKFRPVKENPKTKRLSNRTPTSAEIKEAREWLLKELTLIKPELVVTLGNTPLYSLTDDITVKISDVHGTLIEYKNEEYGLHFNLMPFFHPAAIIYRRELITEYEKDMEKFAEAAKIPYK